MEIQIELHIQIQIQKTSPRFATLTDCSDAAGAITAPILFHGKVAAHHQNYHHGHHRNQNYHHGHDLHQNYHHGHHLHRDYHQPFIAKT